MTETSENARDIEKSKSRFELLKIALLVLFFVLVGPCFSFINGVVRYLSGTATLKISRSVISVNDYFDRELRVHCSIHSDRTRADFGPKDSEFDLKLKKTFDFWPNNTAIRLMIKCFGPMEGTYQGAIPTKEEAFRAIRDVPKTVDSEKFHRSGARTGLPKNPKLIMQYQNVGGSAIMSPLSYGKVGWVTWKDETLIVGNSAAVWLIDKEKGRLYGGYASE